MVATYSNGISPNLFAWSADYSVGYVSQNDETCGALWPATKAGLGSFPGPVTLGGHTWRLEGGGEDYSAPYCDHYGRVSGPMLTPSGLLYFVASPTSQGQSGTARVAQPWNLYSWDRQGAPREVLAGITDLTGVSMSADGSRITFAGSHGGRSGVWDLGLGDGKAVLVTPCSSCSDPGYSPDGASVVFVVGTEGRGRIAVSVLGGAGASATAVATATTSAASTAATSVP